MFGEIIDTYHQARRSGLTSNNSGWGIRLAFADHLKKVWREPDHGIWEMRGPPKHFTYSKVMAWVAYDRAIKSAETFGLEAPLDEWRKLRGEICDAVCEQGFDKELGTFVQASDRTTRCQPVAAALRRILPVSDPRIERTIAAIESRLLRDGFVMRYSTEEVEDALPPGEGAFLASSCADCAGGM